MRRLGCVGALFFLVVAAAGCERLADGLRSQAPPPDSGSAARLAPGPYEIATLDRELVDETRPTMANGDVAGASSRTLPLTVWYPEGAAGPRPLVVYSHGFTGNRRELVYLLEHLASHGYVVAAVDFPLTNGEAPGGANYMDLASQPGDVRFAIDAVLALNAAGEPLAGRIDPERIALAGMSYGGLTTTLLAFHPTEAEPRARAAISIAGPSQMFTEAYFGADGPPFLMIAGTEDGLVPYELNAKPLRQKAPRAELVSIDAGTHLGFVGFARLWMRFSRNPDGAACERIVEAGELETGGELDPDARDDPFAPLASQGYGIDGAAWALPCSAGPSENEAMRPERQQLITMLAVRAYLDSLFAEEASARDEARQYLHDVLPRELPDAAHAGPWTDQRAGRLPGK